MDSISRLEDLKKVAGKLSIDIVADNLFDPEIMIKSGHCKMKGKDITKPERPVKELFML